MSKRQPDPYKKIELCKRLAVEYFLLGLLFIELLRFLWFVVRH